MITPAATSDSIERSIDGVGSTEIFIAPSAISVPSAVIMPGIPILFPNSSAGGTTKSEVASILQPKGVSVTDSIAIVACSDRSSHFTNVSESEEAIGL
jgi:hypothetical protein